jgi:3-isopropylmalate/(R)-2-methylmalate dehydratase small subunit
MLIRGKVWKFGDDVNTDEIIPARYLTSVDPAQLAQHVMEDLDARFAAKVGSGDIILGGKNFGCGSSREHAPVAIKGAGVACVVAKSFARIFFRNCFNMGLLILESPDTVDGSHEGDVLEIRPRHGSIYNPRTDSTWQVKPIPPFMQELLDDGGLIPHLRKKQGLSIQQQDRTPGH